MLGRALSLVAALLLACASTGAHGYVRALQPESAHRGLATAAPDAHRAPAHVTPEAASENSATPAEASDGRRFYAKARYYGAGRGAFLSVDPWDGDPTSPVSLNKYLYGYANPGVYVDPDGRCGMLAFGAAAFGLGSVCDVIDAYTLGLDASTVDPAGKIMRYRVRQGQLAAEMAGNMLVSGAETIGDVAVAGRERLTGESFGASERLGDRLGSAIDGTADYLGNLPVRIVDDVADFTWEFKQARETQDPERMAAVTAPIVVGTLSAGASVVAPQLRLVSHSPRRVIEGQAGKPATEFVDPAVDADLEEAYLPAGRAEEPAQVRVNQFDGARREDGTYADLQAKYPNARIQRQVYLRTADGKRAKDPLTGEARRVDFAVIEDTPDGPRVVDMVETTSPTAKKLGQGDKEQRIRGANGTFVRDRREGCLLDACDVPTREDRRQ